MTVKELIEHLETLDENASVFVRGYEGGYTEIGISDKQKFKLNVNTAWYYGQHESTEDEEYDVEGYVL
jgi:hypothetical protein